MFVLAEGPLNFEADLSIPLVRSNSSWLLIFFFCFCCCFCLFACFQRDSIIILFYMHIYTRIKPNCISPAPSCKWGLWGIRLFNVKASSGLWQSPKWEILRDICTVLLAVSQPHQLLAMTTFSPACHQLQLQNFLYKCAQQLPSWQKGPPDLIIPLLK